MDTNDCVECAKLDGKIDKVIALVEYGNSQHTQVVERLDKNIDRIDLKAEEHEGNLVDHAVRLTKVETNQKWFATVASTVGVVVGTILTMVGQTFFK